MTDLAALPSPLARTADGAPACSQPTPACTRAADYVVATTDGEEPSGRYFCAEHVDEGIARLRLLAEDTGRPYAVTPLREQLPALAFARPIGHPRLKMAFLVGTVVLILCGFAVLAPLMLHSAL